MAAVQKSAAGSSNPGSGLGTCKADEVVPERFPAGLRILVVDDDVTCLKILEQMLRKCDYSVTICSRAMRALSLLRERRGCFDLVISDVHMPDVDGFKLLELVGLEMDLPVIMMSADTRTSTVMKGIKHGACNYLIKPVRLEELKNIWQHVVRKKWGETKDQELSGCVEEPDRRKREVDDAEFASSLNDGADGNWKAQKKRRDSKEDEDEGELESDDPSTSKKPRVVWSVELHQQFVNAVNQLGIDKAVPKRILELMNVPGLTRENVASHLQKFRLYLKRLSAVAQHQGVLPNSFCGPAETNSKVGPFGRLDFQSLVTSGPIPPKTLGMLHADLLGRPSSCVVLPAIEQPILLQASLQGPKCVPVEHGVTFGQPLIKCQPSISKQFPLSGIAVEDVSSGFGTWAPNQLTTVGPTRSIDGLSNSQNSNMLVQMLQQQQQSSQPVLSEPSHAVVQPTSLIAPSHPSTNFQVRNNPISVSQNSLLAPSQSNNYLVGNTTSINLSSMYSNPTSVVDHMLLSSQPNNGPMDIIGQVVDGNLKNVTMLNGSCPGPISSTVTSCLVPPDSSNGWRVANLAPSINPSSSIMTGFFHNSCDTQSSGKNANHPDQGLGRNLGFVGRGTCIPSRFAVDDIDSSSDVQNQKMCSVMDNGSKVKQEIHLDIMEGSKVGNPVLPHFPPNDFMSVLTK